MRASVQVTSAGACEIVQYLCCLWLLRGAFTCMRNSHSGQQLMQIRSNSTISSQHAKLAKSPAAVVPLGPPERLQAACLPAPPALQLLPSLHLETHLRSHAPAAVTAPQLQGSAHCMQGKHRASSGVIAKQSMGQRALIATKPPILSCVSVTSPGTLSPLPLHCWCIPSLHCRLVEASST
jgi:hypothetical protein